MEYYLFVFMMLSAMWYCNEFLAHKARDLICLFLSWIAMFSAAPYVASLLNVSALRALRRINHLPLLKQEKQCARRLIYDLKNDMPFNTTIKNSELLQTFPTNKLASKWLDFETNACRFIKMLFHDTLC